MLNQKNQSSVIDPGMEAGAALVWTRAGWRLAGTGHQTQARDCGDLRHVVRAVCRGARKHLRGRKPDLQHHFRICWLAFRALQAWRELSLHFRQSMSDQHVGGRRIGNQACQKSPRIVRQIVHDDPCKKRMPSGDIGLDRSGHHAIDDLDRHPRSETDRLHRCKSRRQLTFLMCSHKAANLPDMTDVSGLRPATPDEIATALSFALRYRGRKRVFDADDPMARITADRLVQHLEASGFVVMKKPPALAPTTTHMPPSSS
jgi:hypothetical protein